MESVVENPGLGAFPRRPSRGACSRESSYGRRQSQMGQRRWNALAPAPERSSDAKEAYARRVGEAGRDRRASSGWQPLHTKEITKRVIESGRSSGLKGKTPEATVAAMLAVGSKPGGSFKRVDKGTYTLADDLAESATAKPKKPEAKPPKRTSGNARKRTSRNAQTAA